jgi:hypothetical protein
LRFGWPFRFLAQRGKIRDAEIADVIKGNWFDHHSMANIKV